MEQSSLREMALEPAVIEEWEDEDDLGSVLSGHVENAGPDEIAEMLSSVRFTLPPALTAQDLFSYAGERATDLDPVIRADSERYDYMLVEVPLSVLVPLPDHLVRLRLSVPARRLGT